MKVLVGMARPILRYATLALLLCITMVGILALEGRLQFVRKQLFDSESVAEEWTSAPRAAQAALPRLAGSTAFLTLPAAMDPSSFAALERELLQLRDRQREHAALATEREAALSEREQQCTAWEERLKQVEQELQRTAERLELETAELSRDLELYSTAQAHAERRLARALEEMAPQIAASTLAAQPNAIDAARLFAHLSADRQAAIAAAFSEDARARFWPAWLKVEAARAAEQQRRGR